MRTSWMVGYSASILVGAAVIKRATESSTTLGALASREAVHIVAHLGLYGGLAALALASGLSAWRATAVTLGVATMQEGVQLITVGRGPGAPELFDIFVDAVALIAVLVAFRLRRRLATTS